MIKVYDDGASFVEENESFLDLNKYLAIFFYLDAKILNNVDKNNYAIKAEDNDKKILGIRVEPYNLCLYGDFECANLLMNYLKDNNYYTDGILCPTTIGDKLIGYDKIIGMDFMEAKEKTMENSQRVLKACKNDVDVIFELSKEFFIECGLPDVPDKEKILYDISNFRIIRENGKIVAMASYTKDTKKSFRITHVYTRPECRGKGYAKEIVNFIKNEILAIDFIPTLNVDQKNPISYHIYESLGFKKIFSQGMYRKKD